MSSLPAKTGLAVDPADEYGVIDERFVSKWLKCFPKKPTLLMLPVDKRSTGVNVGVHTGWACFDDEISTAWLDKEQPRKLLDPILTSDIMVTDPRYLRCSQLIFEVSGALPLLMGQGARWPTLAFERQLSWCNHCSVLLTVMPTPHKASLARYVAAFDAFVASNELNTRFAIRMPIAVRHDGTWAADDDTWELWDKFRTMSSYPQLLSVALELHVSVKPKQLKRWIAEPLSLLIFGQDVTYDVSTEPSLLKAEFITEILCWRVPPRIVLRVQAKDVAEESAPLLAEHMYQGVIQKAKRLLLRRGDRQSAQFEDVLQAPLQPLKDHLEAGTYEVFEADRPKYELYEDAILAALRDRVQSGKLYHRIAVVGAGRGPLVDAAFRAVRTLAIDPRRVTMLVVEKNPNAMITLEHRQRADPDEMWREVRLVHSDMRELVDASSSVDESRLGQELSPTAADANAAVDTPLRSSIARSIDIMVSELLGSFGDNELSPECIHGAAQTLLAPDGISIPVEYTSYLEPIAAPILWLEARRLGGTALESPYVVHMKRVVRIANPEDVPIWGRPGTGSKPCFSFNHTVIKCGSENGHHSTSYDGNGSTCYGRLRDAKDFNRTSTVSYFTIQSVINQPCRHQLTWKAALNERLHGFAGYFEAMLYMADSTNKLGAIGLSTVPGRHTKSMESWYPMFFPLVEPVQVRKGDTITVAFGRHCTGHQVWYEWQLLEPVVSRIANLQGKAFSMRL